MRHRRLTLGDANGALLLWAAFAAVSFALGLWGAGWKLFILVAVGAPGLFFFWWLFFQIIDRWRGKS
jgi:hypothetical protein